MPLNERLDTAGDGEAAWQDYRTRWGAWNHVRTVTALVASTLFLIGLVNL